MKPIIQFIDAPPRLPKTNTGVEFRVAVSPKYLVNRDMLVGNVAAVPEPMIAALRTNIEKELESNAKIILVDQQAIE